MNEVSQGMTNISNEGDTKNIQPIPRTTETDTLPITGEEFRFGNILFTSKFDSGNLAKVEKVYKDASETDKPCSYMDPISDMEYNLWTRPDAAGTEYENGNRSWFYFGIRGYSPGKVIKLNIMNMNKQGKLYSQGHTPVCRVLPQKPNWERLRDRCSFENTAAEFILTFHYRFPECRGTVYFAFCFPWSYTESQQQMERLDRVYLVPSVPPAPSSTGEDTPDTQAKQRNPNDIYYHRELMIRTLDNLRVDLITISSHHGISDELEPRFHSKLFPDPDTPRCRNFTGKRVYVLTSRVHPGESPASSVFNGFLDFILRPDDRRARQLRQQYVFKMIPMLNPDGVVRGHYRTDSRGVNLNRVYLDPDPSIYPTIFAAKSLLVFHHINNCVNKNEFVPDMSIIFKDIQKPWSNPSLLLSTPRTVDENGVCSSASLSPTRTEPEPDQTFSSKSSLRCVSAGSFIDTPVLDDICSEGTQHLNHPRLRLIPANESGIAFYIDLHGHASKRGCFIYGNHFEEEEKALLNLLFPKLIAMNSAHFDFGGCNFTERNMYTKDKRDIHSKEGSGRVAIYKSIGITHSYTLECNYNSGRLVNSIASVPHPITPPPMAGFPPKYMESHFKEVGQACAIAAIDYTETNSWSRIQYSELNSLYGVKDHIRKSFRGGRGAPKFTKPNLSTIPLHARFNNNKTNGIQAVKSEPIIRSRPQVGVNRSEKPSVAHTFSKTPRFTLGDSDTNSIKSSSTSSQTTAKRRELVPVREGGTKRSYSLPSPTILLKCHASSQKEKSGSSTEIARTRSYSLRLMHTMSRQNNTTIQVMKETESEQTVPPTQPSSKDETGHNISSQDPTAPIGESPNSSEVKQVTETVYDTSSPNPKPSFTKGKALVVTKDINKKISPKVPVALPPEVSAVLEQGRELGVSLEPTGFRVKGRRKPSASRKKSLAASEPVEPTVKKGLGMKGAPIKLTMRLKGTGNLKTSPDGKQAEMDNFEQQLRGRISSLEHSSAYWVEL